MKCAMTTVTSGGHYRCTQRESISSMPPCRIRAAARVKTLRTFTSSISEDDCLETEIMLDRAESMSFRSKEGKPLTKCELDHVIRSLQNVTPHNFDIDWDSLRSLLADICHLSHKNWQKTAENSDKMAKILIPDGLTPNSSQIFERILHEGNWDEALCHVRSNSDISKGVKFNKRSAWAVLVTGVNGIRKTTAMYQPWFPELLHEALVAPPGTKYDFTEKELPSGKNSFFRQLDHMIATLCNEEFSILYALTGAKLNEYRKEEGDLPLAVIQQYSKLKASIFSRYRTLSELLGIILLKEAHKMNINVLCETSGRDKAMFHYIDHFFGSNYNKLAIHFTVNDLNCAMKSVDARMEEEIIAGQAAVNSGDVFEIIYTNKGGPYGANVLGNVQAESDRVWNEVTSKGDILEQGWHTATLRIEASSSTPWTIRAVKPDGSLGKEYTFVEASSK